VNVYFDTSAIAKWYIAESDSDAVESLVERATRSAISRLTAVELQSALSRRRRNREISGAIEREALALFDGHVRDGVFDVFAMQDAHFIAAREIMHNLRRLPLRTLDALHLAVARAHQVEAIATADQVMSVAARALQFRTFLFH
jgi:predicted nucleic acid-binding protein